MEMITILDDSSKQALCTGLRKPPVTRNQSTHALIDSNSAHRSSCANDYHRREPTTIPLPFISPYACV